MCAGGTLFFRLFREALHRRARAHQGVLSASFAGGCSWTPGRTRDPVGQLTQVLSPQGLPSFPRASCGHCCGTLSFVLERKGLLGTLCDTSPVVLQCLEQHLDHRSFCEMDHT